MAGCPQLTILAIVQIVSRHRPDARDVENTRHRDDAG
jgi:hypothetical protein